MNTLQRVEAEFKREDEKLKAAGFAGSGSNPQVAVYGPNDEYPMPWHIKGSPEGIYTLYANNYNQVAGWLTEGQARAILEEVKS